MSTSPKPPTPAKSARPAPTGVGERVVVGRVAGAASGVGIGTMFLYWVNALPADHAYKPLLLLAAPTLTVASAGLAAGVTRFGRWATWEVRHRYGIKRMRATIARQLKADHLTDARRTELHAELEQIDRYEIDQQREYLF